MLENHHIHFASIPSTQRYAKENIKSFDPNGLTCISTDHQTHGYGRKDHSWLSPVGKCLTATFHFLLTPTCPKQNLAQLLAFTTIELLREMGYQALFKWPNDILLSGDKMGGILAEVLNEHALIGIGLNVNMSKDECDLIDQRATSMLINGGKETSIENLRKELQNRFQSDLTLFLSEGFTPFLDKYQLYLSYKGEEVIIYDEDRETRGIVSGLHEDGRLILICEGQISLISNGILRLA